MSSNDDFNWDEIEDISYVALFDCQQNDVFFGHTHRFAHTTKFKPSHKPIVSKRKVIDTHTDCARKRVRLSEEPIILAHDPTVHKLIGGFCTGVKLELARLVSLARTEYEDIINCTSLSELVGTNAEAAPITASTLLETASPSGIGDALTDEELAATSPWQELDREQAALRENTYGGLGNNLDHPGWFGGKVQFRGTVEKSKDGSLRIKLDRTLLSTSCRFTRRFGSTAFIRVKVSPDLKYNEHKDLGEFFRRPLVIWNSVYRAFFAKEGSVFFFRTNERFDVYDRWGTIDDHSTMSLWDFIQWANPITSNQSQKLCKWASRFRLGLSDSVPGPQIEAENIKEIEDVVSRSGSDMTDGCGLSNRALHLTLRNEFSLGTTPTAFQFRLAGAKGMLSLNLEEDLRTEDPNDLKVSLRGSQIKIRFPKQVSLDPAHLTLDLLRFSRMRTPSNLSAELIINLHHNGVPDTAFINLLSKSVDEVVAPLLQWDGKDAMIRLWCKIEEAEHVLAARRGREAVAESRINGGRDVDDDDVDDGDGFEVALGQRSTAWWPDPISGCPSSLAETVMALLDAGFHPRECPILREKLEQVAKTKVRQTARKCHYKIEQSLSAFVIPDPYGVLGPDEIQIKSSKSNLKRSDGIETNVVLGDVLLTRSPCKVPTDVRKVKAVEHHKLHALTDVIVCTIQGHRRLLDFLGGGDYDGDRATAIWDPELTIPFKNADEKYSVPPAHLDKWFEVDKRTVGQFCTLMEYEDEEEKLHELQPVLLGELRDPSVLGQYSNYHTHMVYTNGYDHPLTIAMAYRFATIMDGAKTGYTIRPERHKADQKYSQAPDWRAVSKGKEATGPSPLRRLCSQNVFIMDTLLVQAKKIETDWLAKVEMACQSPTAASEDPSAQFDADLLKPYITTRDLANSRVDVGLIHDLGLIRGHVKAIAKLYSKEVRGPAFTAKKIEERQDTLRKLSALFHSSPTMEEMKTITDTATLATLRASLAYHDDIVMNADKSDASSRFPFSVAFRDLCGIKSRAGQNCKTSTNAFYQHFKVVAW